MKRLKLLVLTVLFSLVLGVVLTACGGGKELTQIILDTQNVRTEFTVGDEFTYEGLVVTAAYDDGSFETVSDYTVSAPDMTAAGEKAVTVTYKEKTAEYVITISPNEDDVKPSERTLQSISLNVGGVKREFRVGDKFTCEGLVVTAHFNVSPLTETVADYTVNEDELTELMSVAGHWTVVVRYQGKTASYEIVVA